MVARVLNHPLQVSTPGGGSWRACSEETRCLYTNGYPTTAGHGIAVNEPSRVCGRPRDRNAAPVGIKDQPRVSQSAVILAAAELPPPGTRLRRPPHPAKRAQKPTRTAGGRAGTSANRGPQPGAHVVARQKGTRFTHEDSAIPGDGSDGIGGPRVTSLHKNLRTGVGPNTAGKSLAVPSPLLKKP